MTDPALLGPLASPARFPTSPAAPFDVAAKQALLEAPGIAARADLLVQLLRFFGRHDGDEMVTLQ